MSRKIAPTLLERIRTPEFKEGVERHTKKLDAEEAGWVVLDPKTYRALRSAARAAEALRREFRWDEMAPGPLARHDVAMFRALRRLRPSPPRRAGGGR
jgi:hypothetical protein